MQAMSPITAEFITSKISNVSHPKSGESVLKFISKIVVNDGVVVFGIKANKSDLESFHKMKDLCEKQLQGIDGIKKLSISLYAEDPKIEKATPVKGVKKVIVVASGKGGVGKSTIAFNLALALAELGKKVGIVDVDIYGPSLPQLSGIHQKPVIDNDLVIPHSKFGIKLMSVGYLVEPGAALVWRGPMTSKMLFQLIRMTNWGVDGELDYLIVDTPPGTGDVHLSLAENYKIDGAIVVSTPQELATTDAAKGIDMFSKLNIKVLGIVQNMSYFEDSNGEKHYIFGKDGASKLAKKYKVELLADLPISKDLAEACDSGKPLVLMDRESNISSAFRSLASRVIA